MTDRQPQILLVDDIQSVEEDIRIALTNIGQPPEIDYRCPKNRDIPFGCALPEGPEFNKYDLALIDLELFPITSDLDYVQEDLRGGTEVLPYLRQEAPWLPVIAISRLFKRESEHFLS